MFTEFSKFSELRLRHCKWPFWLGQQRCDLMTGMFDDAMLRCVRRTFQLPIDFVICQTSICNIEISSTSHLSLSQIPV